MLAIQPKALRVSISDSLVFPANSNISVKFNHYHPLFILILLCCFNTTQAATVQNNYTKAGTQTTFPVAIITYLLSGSSAPVVLPGGTSLLNDTGIIFCANATTNGLTCPETGYPGQDAEYGRDKTSNNDADGHAGFSFTKLSGSGQALSAGAVDWSCVKDNITGLIWEVKTTDAGLQDSSHTYTWYNSTGTNDGGSAGKENGGSCYDSGYCDTEGYVQKMNQQGLCGASDWRLPTVFELEGLVNFDRVNPAIDSDYFPETQSLYYWSASPRANYSDGAWDVSFYSGYPYNQGKGDSKYVRLVRAGQ